MFGDLLLCVQGWTMIATPVLPITRHTLVYGSNDAGVTVHKSDAHMNRLMDLAAQRLNLKPHMCGLAQHLEELAAPTDIEGCVLDLCLSATCAHCLSFFCVHSTFKHTSDQLSLT